MSSIAHRGFVHLGMDVSKNSIAVAVLPPDRDVAQVDKIFHDTDSIRRLVKQIGRPKGIWACYEAGPTGYDLQRLLTSMGVRCDVVAPSLIPKGSGDRVKTDRRDARRLAGLHRAGELTPVAVPTPAQDGVRDLCRTRADMVQDLTRARNRLSGFLLRHSVVGRGGSPWTERHRRWLTTRSFDDPALAATYSHYLATVKLRDTALEAVEADLSPWCGKDPFGEQVARLAAYRGVTSIGALCLAAEVFDWRRFPKARPFMSFTGLVPGESSTGQTQRRGSITRSGNSHLRGQHRGFGLQSESPEPPGQIPVDRPIHVPSQYSLAVAGRPFAGRLDIAEVPGDPVGLLAHFGEGHSTSSRIGFSAYSAHSSPVMALGLSITSTWSCSNIGVSSHCSGVASLNAASGSMVYQSIVFSRASFPPSQGLNPASLSTSPSPNDGFQTWQV